MYGWIFPPGRRVWGLHSILPQAAAGCQAIRHIHFCAFRFSPAIRRIEICRWVEWNHVPVSTVMPPLCKGGTARRAEGGLAGSARATAAPGTNSPGAIPNRSVCCPIPPPQFANWGTSSPAQEPPGGGWPPKHACGRCLYTREALGAAAPVQITIPTLPGSADQHILRCTGDYPRCIGGG